MMICLSIMALIRISYIFFCESTDNTLTLTSSGYLMRDIWLYNTSPICCGNGFAKSEIGCLSLSLYLDECLLLLYLFIVDFGIRLFFGCLISISRSFLLSFVVIRSQCRKSFSIHIDLLHIVLVQRQTCFGSFRDRWNK